MVDDETRTILEEIRRRLAALEAFRWMIVGGLAVIVALVIPIVLNVIFGWR